MNLRNLLIALFALIVCHPAMAQRGFTWGPKAGVALGMQQWNGFSRSVLTRWHADVFIESWTPENRFSLFAMGGYHIRGSALRTRGWYDPETMMDFPNQTTPMEFHNLVLTLGAKQKFPFGYENRAYYLLGVRGEYTVGTEFESYLDYLEGAENKLVFGVSAGTGLEFFFGEFVSGFLELSVHPDFSRQLFIPRQDTGFNDPISGQPIIIEEQKLYNVTVEISLGLHFLRKVIYLD